MNKKIIVSIERLCIIFFLPVFIQASSLNYITNTVRDNNSFIEALVIGGGPAGLAAASCIAREKKHTVVLMGDGRYRGGQLMASKLVDNMPGFLPQQGYEIMEKMEQQTRAWGAYLVDDTAVLLEADSSGEFFVVTTEQGRVLHALTVIIATGSTARKLAIPGAETYDNKGIYTCAVCETGHAKGKHTAVIGGGDAALDAVMHLVSWAPRMTVVVRKGHMRASHSLQNKIKEFDTVEVLYNREPIKFEGDGEKITGILTRDMVTGTEELIPVGAVFLAIGHTPNSDLVKNFIQTDQHGCIVLDGRSQRTSRKGIFAAGDVTDNVYRQASAASGDGGKSGLDALSYLHQQTYLTAQELKTLEPYYFRPLDD